MAETSPEGSSLEEVYGRVTHSFLITSRPEGAVPDEIREMWIGVSLPVREELCDWPRDYRDDLTGEQRHNESPVAVLVEDAVISLIDQGKQEAANFWGSNFSPVDTLVFRGENGFLAPVVDENH